jgi:hypothetical protein
VVDREPVVQIPRRIAQKRVVGMTLRHHQMRGQRNLGRAHRPHMQVVHA